ncbi:MAG: MFS transporter [Patescibacteria group bacterium]|nr:MFS transporter [Patescibacteria group bacterium]
MNGRQDKRQTDIWFFAAASFLNDFGHFLFTAIWPVFVTVTLGASVTFLGFVDGFGTAMESISQAVSGMLSDKIRKRKIFIWLGYLLPSIASLIYASSYSEFQLTLGKFFDRSGKMRDAPRDAIVADETEHGKRATAFGVLRAADRGGAFLGLAASAILVSYLTYRQLFLLSAIPGFIGTMIILWFIRESRPTDGSDKTGISLKNAGSSLKIFTFLSLVFTLGSFSDSFYILAAEKRGISLVIVPLIYLAYVFVSFASAVPFGKLADKAGRKAVLAVAYVMLAAANTVFIFSKSILSFVLAFAVYGLHYGAYKGNVKAFVADLSPKNMRASYLGGFEMLVGLVSLPASVLAGFLWQGVSPTMTFSFSILTSLLTLLIIPWVKEPRSDV